MANPAEKWQPGDLPPTFVAGFHDEDAVRKMPYRRFGSRVVSQLTYGASALGGVFGSTGSKDEAKALVREFVQQGGNLIDVAPWYGHGVAEEALGECLKGIPREAYYLTTKCARYQPGPLEMFDFSYERTLKSVQESLARMGVEYIDTLQVHDPEFAPSLDVVVSQTLPAMQEAVKRGWVRAIGITGYPLPMLKELHAKAAAAGIAVESCLSYCHYNLHDTSLVDSGLLAHLTAAGVGVLNGSPLSMSLLTQTGAPVWHPAKPELKARAVAAAAYCAERGLNIERLGMAFALAHPDIPTTLFSTSRLAKLRANMAQATGDAPLSEAESAALAHIRTAFFGPTPDLPDYASIQSWEGVEVQKVHAKVGRALLQAWYDRKAATAAAAAATGTGTGAEAKSVMLLQGQGQHGQQDGGLVDAAFAFLDAANPPQHQQQ